MNALRMADNNWSQSWKSNQVNNSTKRVECPFYLLQEHIEKDLKRWHEENQQRTKKSCQKLLHGLKKKHLDPIFQRLTGPMGASVSFDQIKDSVLAIESDFNKLAKGAKDVCAQEFFKFQPVRVYVYIKNSTQCINVA